MINEPKVRLNDKVYGLFMLHKCKWIKQHEQIFSSPEQVQTTTTLLQGANVKQSLQLQVLCTNYTVYRV